MIRVQCEACGSSELKRRGNTYICGFCGSKYFFDKDEQEIDSELTDVKVIELIEESKKLHENDRYIEELNVLNKALSLDSNNSRIMTHLGRCYRSLNKANIAMDFYKKALELDPNEGVAYANMGTIYIGREEYEEAKQCYDKALPLIDKCNFDYWIVYANYAIAVAKLGDKKTAEKMIRKSENRGYKDGDDIRRMAGIKKNSFFSRLFS